MWSTWFYLKFFDHTCCPGQLSIYSILSVARKIALRFEISRLWKLGPRYLKSLTEVLLCTVLFKNTSRILRNLFRVLLKTSELQVCWIILFIDNISLVFLIVTIISQILFQSQQCYITVIHVSYVYIFYLNNTFVLYYYFFFTQQELLRPWSPVYCWMMLL